MDRRARVKGTAGATRRHRAPAPGRRRGRPRGGAGAHPAHRGEDPSQQVRADRPAHRTPSGAARPPATAPTPEVPSGAIPGGSPISTATTHSEQAAEERTGHVAQLMVTGSLDGPRPVSNGAVSNEGVSNRARSRRITGAPPVVLGARVAPKPAEGRPVRCRGDGWTGEVWSGEVCATGERWLAGTARGSGAAVMGGTIRMGSDRKRGCPRRGRPAGRTGTESPVCERLFVYGRAMPPAVPAQQRRFDDLGTPLHDVTFCVIDLETTGGSRHQDAITEVAAVRYRGGERLDSSSRSSTPAHRSRRRSPT